MSDVIERKPARTDGLWCRCRDFVEEQSCGEWDDKTIADDADKLMEFIYREIIADRTTGRDSLFNEMVKAIEFVRPFFSPHEPTAPNATDCLRKLDAVIEKVST